MYNRWAIEGQAHREVQASLRYRHALSIGLVDVDPSCLSPEGPLQAATEEVVRRLACILDRSVREVDSVGRLEGARFLIVARETEERGAARLAERIRAQVEATPFPCRGQTTPLTVSLGFAVAPGETAFALEDMTRVAEDALAEARKAGGNRRVVRTVPPAAHGG